jgi:hypothetical protein
MTVLFIAAITAAIAAIGVIRIPVVSPGPSSENAALLAAINLSWEASALLAAKVPSGEVPAIVAAVDASGKKPTLLTTIDPPSREKPAIIAAKVREAYVHCNPATAAPTPAIPALCNGVRWIPNCQRDQS